MRLVFSSAIFPAEGTALKADIKAKRSDVAPLATLTTGNGGLTVVSTTTLDILMPATATRALKAGFVSMDVARTDTDPDEIFAFALTIPVQMPVTRAPT